MSELKPCPFCGGEARFKVWGNVVGVECDRCGIGTHTACIDEYQNAIDAWNTRAERTCKRVDVDGYSFRFECSACGYVALVHNCETRLDELPNYCPNCGAKVVEHD